ncbi:MAG: OmpA family protein [Deltaproteobacteria bacterium]|jgi:chemotaxis protein MotB|nr:OmpA family protein [Deltaproteobacteria bacterium]
MAQRKSQEPQEQPPDTTMVLYTSMVLILLTFFIMISAKANFDETKYGKAVESVTRTFGFLPGGLSAIGGPDGIAADAVSFRDGMGTYPVQDREMNEIRSLLSPGIMDGDARITHNSGQRIITLSAGLLFPRDSSEITPEARETLLAFCRIMRGSRVPISIEGHTDSLPPQTEGAGDNWDISVNRALAVLELFAGEGGLPMERLSAFGYGGSRPQVANNSPANRRRNNRVDLVLDFESSRAGSLRDLTGDDRSYDFQGFEFQLPERPGEEGEVY